MLRGSDAETAVIGAMIRDNSLVQEIATIVDERDFLSHFCRKAFAACVGMSGSFDELILATVMGKAHVDAIVSAVDSTTTTTAALEHAKRVANAAVLRRFVEACSEATVEAVDLDTTNIDDVLELVTRHQTAILDVTVKRKEACELVHGKDGMRALMKLLEERRDRFTKKLKRLPGFSTGFGGIDSLIGGLQRKAMVVIGAQTGVGKSAMAVNMATNALRDGAKVAILSHEMSTDDVYSRQLAAESRVVAASLQSGDIHPSDWSKLDRAQGEISKLPIWVTDSPPRNIPKVINTCLQHKRRHGLDIVFVDYLQLMEGTRMSGNREQVVAEIARGLKQVAMDLDVCVVALSQLNYTTSRHEEPSLQSLRESAAIAQNANSVILLWSTDDKSQEICFKVAKNRSGPHGNGKLQFHKHLQRFQDPAPW